MISQRGLNLFSLASLRASDVSMTPKLAPVSSIALTSLTFYFFVDSNQFIYTIRFYDFCLSLNHPQYTLLYSFSFSLFSLELYS